MKYVTVLLVFFFSTFRINGSAQERTALRTGETVPDFSFSIVDSNNSIAYLREFKEKLIIIDFWGTWCSSCISFFPTLDTLQNIFKKDLKIILVNSIKSGDDRKKVIAFLDKRRSVGKPINLTIAAEDSIAMSLFPFIYVPTYVWISPNGKLLGVTGKEFVTETNIRSILESERSKQENK